MTLIKEENQNSKFHVNKLEDWSLSYTKAYSHSIGRGSFGQVWLVRSNRNGKCLAMKEIDLDQFILKCSIINKAYALDEGLKLLHLGIDHPNVVKYYESFMFNNFIYWIMDYCDGGTLKDRINLYVKNENSFEEDLIWFWSLQIFNAIKYLHGKGVIHRDLKPDNVFIENKFGSCKIGDFGLAKVLVDISISDNTAIKIERIDLDENEEDKIDDHWANYSPRENSNLPTQKTRTYLNEETTAYKLIKLSQVGTPSYMSPE